MNLHFTGEAYANAQGLTLREPGTYEIDNTIAEFLLATYPQWFTTTEEAQHIEPQQDEQADQPISEEQTYEVEVDEPEALADAEPGEIEVVETDETSKPVSRMNRGELEALATEIGLEVTDEHKTNKDLQEAIKAHQEAA